MFQCILFKSFIIWILAYLFDGRWTANRSTWTNFKGWRRR